MIRFHDPYSARSKIEKRNRTTKLTDWDDDAVLKLAVFLGFPRQESAKFLSPRLKIVFFGLTQKEIVIYRDHFSGGRAGAGQVGSPTD